MMDGGCGLVGNIRDNNDVVAGGTRWEAKASGYSGTDTICNNCYCLLLFKSW
mgnify:FL=1